MNAFDPDIRHAIDVHIVHGFWKSDDANRLALAQEAAQFPNVRLHVAPMPEMFGTHHSKMMVLFRRDDTAQVVIHTANMIAKDWTNMTNAVWRSPSLPKLQYASAPPSGFKADLLAYLASYDRRGPICKPLADQLAGYDFSIVKAALVASVPGRHDTRAGTLWGWAALERRLKSVPCRAGDSEVVVQISSMATLGPRDDWLQKTLFDSLAHCRAPCHGQARSRFKVVFPTADEIRLSLDGYASGGSIHTKTQSRQQTSQLEYLRPILYHWANDSRHGRELPAGSAELNSGRSRAAPHVKTYIRFNADKSIDWALLTSANLSKQAWGEARKPTGEMRIASWEMGVLVWPELYGEDSSMVGAFGSDKPDVDAIAAAGAKNGAVVGVRIPYSVPLQRYATPSPTAGAESGGESPDTGRARRDSTYIQRGDRGGRGPSDDPRWEPLAPAPCFAALTLMERGRPIPSPRFASPGRPLPGSLRMLSGSPVADDIAACSESEEDDDFIDDSLALHGHGMYRRPSGVAYGTSRPVFNQQIMEEPFLTPIERKQSRNAERSLLRDNRVLPPKHPAQAKSQNLFARIYRRLFSTRVPPAEDDVDQRIAPLPPPTERTSLLHNGADDGLADGDELEQQWEEAVASGRLRTTWQRETKTVVAYSAPLVVTFFLQYSISVTSVFAVGRIGKLELGAVSLATMTMSVTCLAPFMGLATSLDTLCSQAYGSGHKHLVGLQCQRMVAFLSTLTAPIAVLWLFSDRILVHIVPDPDSARLAGQYLKIMILAIPSIILFEVGKRFLQAQGLFRATTLVLVAAAPLNILINWLLVWKAGLGFIGAPIAVVITENLLPVLLILYVIFIDGSQCWGGFSKRALTNWWPMIKLALPGMIMVEAEWMAFEALTLIASRFGTEYLAAQSALSTLATISYQVPFPVSIAASTRVANLIGAGMVDAARTTAKVTFAAVCVVGIVNLTIYSTLRFRLPMLFTNDETVIAIVAKTLPLVAVVQVFDGLGAGAHGLLRGIGKQSIGGPANLFAYYIISLPISLGLAFGADWKLLGMWAGLIVGLVSVSIIEYTYLLMTDWHQAAAEAAARNAAGHHRSTRTTLKLGKASIYLYHMTQR
ncbi:hypothetical protein L249_4087 [Ophiocordyceps polyrhachis-furcata BCC 54312]|uniref:PLD phosphodiesterase domain-containing protein n=1 Tax=Ophiocordyceps polyrhachis-furcata BCC 54312 TaxID=1330021 RepID=A0A367L524_9HYPO|nr:hypothetical protein L249_4087 [Ophiocordyceps polyrhachis-furcata BCC 54312]